MTVLKRVLLAVACVLAAGVPERATHAELLSSNPITVVIPYAPGASADVIMRLVTQKVTEDTDQQFIIMNRGGSGGVAAALVVKQAVPDGHTLLELVVGTHATSQRVAAEPPYDLLKDFAPITLLWNMPQFLTVPNVSPVRSVADLVALAQSKPGGLSFAS